MKKVICVFTVILFLLMAFCSCRQAGIGENSSSDSILYRNSKYGFSLQFPKSWDGNYLIRENKKNQLEINFVGASNLSKYGLDGSKDIVGTNMFYIAKEKYIGARELADSLKKIGSVNGADLYYFTSTDDPIGGLDLSSEAESNPNQKKLANEDYKKARKMQQDIDSILETFEPLK